MTVSMCMSLPRKSMPSAVSSQVGMSSTPCSSAIGFTAFALSVTSMRLLPLAAGAIVRTTAGEICRSSDIGGVSPSWLLVSPVEASAMRSVIWVPPRARTMASAARRTPKPRLWIVPRGISVSDISAHFLRHIKREHALHGGIDERVGEILEMHRVQGASADIERRSGLRIFHQLRTGELHRVRDLGEARGVDELDLVKGQAQGIAKPGDLASFGKVVEGADCRGRPRCREAHTRARFRRAPTLWY